MAIRYTFHGQPPAAASGYGVQALPAQVGNHVDVADGSVSGALAEGLYKINATSNSMLRWDSASLTDGTGGTQLDSGDWLVAYIKEGMKIGVSAYA